MRKINLGLKIFGAVFAAGILILMYSINLGDNEVTSMMHTNGGSMDTNTYMIYLEQSITKYRFLGSIVSLLGGLGLLQNIEIKS